MSGHPPADAYAKREEPHASNSLERNQADARPHGALLALAATTAPAALAGDSGDDADDPLLSLHGTWRVKSVTIHGVTSPCPGVIRNFPVRQAVRCGKADKLVLFAGGTYRHTRLGRVDDGTWVADGRNLMAFDARQDRDDPWAVLYRLRANQLWIWDEIEVGTTDVPMLVKYVRGAGGR